MDVAAIIERLGGREAVAQATGSQYNSVWYWERRGRIPPRHWPRVLELAGERGEHTVSLPVLSKLWNNATAAQAVSRAL